MPQDVPIEASEMLVFTPESLKRLDNPPVFSLRAATWREKRFHTSLNREEGVEFYDTQMWREEVLNGFRAKWAPEYVEPYAPILQGYWDAWDVYETQKKEDEDLVFEFDPVVKMAINELIEKIRQVWPPLRRLDTVNADSSETMMLTTVAVVLASWERLSVNRDIDRGYITVECAYAVKEALQSLELKHGLKAGTAWMELYVEATMRLYLSKDTEKNSESPSPSEMTPPASTETTTLVAAGKSPAPARSKKTRGGA